MNTPYFHTKRDISSPFSGKILPSEEGYIVAYHKDQKKKSMLRK